MNLLTWLKFGHILGAMIWIGGGVMLSLIGIRVRQSEDAHYIREFSRTLSYVGLRVLMPAVIAVLVFGVWMVFAFSAWQFTQLWILLALGAFALAFIVILNRALLGMVAFSIPWLALLVLIAFFIGAVYLSRIALALDKLAASTDFNLEMAHNLLSRWIVGYQIVLLILLFAVWDMVFKPGI